MKALYLNLKSDTPSRDAWMGGATQLPTTRLRNLCRLRGLPVGAAAALAGMLVTGSALAGLNPNGNPTGVGAAWDRSRRWQA